VGSIVEQRFAEYREEGGATNGRAWGEGRVGRMKQLEDLMNGVIIIFREKFWLNRRELVMHRNHGGHGVNNRRKGNIWHAKTYVPLTVMSGEPDRVKRTRDVSERRLQMSS
jgi:hypothetical protein